MVRTRVASSDWCASRNVVSVTPTAVDSRIHRGEPLGPEFGQPLLAARRRRRVRSISRQLVVRVHRRRPRAVRLVDRDIGEVVEDLGAAVGRRARGQQIRAARR